MRDKIENRKVLACAATVIAGGLELMNKGIQAQCVLLNQSGCRHWSNKHDSTSLNLNGLLYRIGLPSESSAKPDKEKTEGQKSFAA